MLTVRLDSDLEQRLDRLAKRSGRPKSFHARMALVNYLDDLEDVYLAESRLAAIRAGREETHPLSDLLAEYPQVSGGLAVVDIADGTRTVLASDVAPRSVRQVLGGIPVTPDA